MESECDNYFTFIMDLLPYIERGTSEEHKPTLFNYVAQLVIPLLAMTVSIFGVVKKPSPLLWGALGLALLLLVLGISPTVLSTTRRWTERARDRRAVRNAFPEFKNLVRRFGEFVDIQTNNTLHSIMNNEVNRAPGRTVAVPPVPNIGLWNNFWYFLSQRIQRQQPSLSEFQSTWLEFCSLVTLYDTTCVLPIFNYGQLEFRNWLAASAKGSLNEFQHRFLDFLLDYEHFAKELADSRPIFRDIPRHFPHPNPL